MIAPDQLVHAIDVHMVLVAVVALAVLFRPSAARQVIAGNHREGRIGILLAPLGGLVFPPLRFLAVLDSRILLARVVVAWHRHNRGIQYLPASRDVALPGKVMIKQLEQVIDLARLRQRLAIQPHSLGVRHPVSQPQPEETPSHGLQGQTTAG